MSHPLKERSLFRERVAAFLRDGYEFHQSSNIVFVCGAPLSDQERLRARFKNYCDSIQEFDFEIFMPEYALDALRSPSLSEPFDLGLFEALIGELSHAIVIFPEAPGSYAEVGYFSNIPALRSKSILVLDSSFQGSPGFIGLGPARHYESHSKYSSNLQIDYKNPDFNLIVQKIGFIKRSRHRENIDLSSIQISSFKFFSFIANIYRFMRIATVEDVLFISRLVANRRFKHIDILHISSILHGAGYLKRVPEHPHYVYNTKRSLGIQVKNNMKSIESSLKLDLIERIEGSELNDVWKDIEDAC